MSFRTPTPAKGRLFDTPYNDARLTFNAQGETFLDPQELETNGTYKVTDKDGGELLFNGSVVTVTGCCLTNDSNRGKPLHVFGDRDITILTSCSTSATNLLAVYSGEEDFIGAFQGPVECSSSSSMTAGTTTSTTQDRDGDGIPDANDNCPNIPHTRCYIEGTQSMAGNQTR